MDLPALALAFGVAWTPVVAPAPQAKIVLPAGTPTAYDSTGAAHIWDEALADLAGAKLVAVGESHDQATHHQLQADVLAGLAARVPRLAVAFEMVGFEDQATLDAYMSGAMSETDFAAWWKKNWGYDFAIYKPIFDAAKAAGVPAYGLNAPRDLIKAVSRGGLTSLSPADRARLPAVVQESADARYRKFVYDSIAGHGPLTPDQLKNRTEAMAVWNETMGEKAAAIAATGRVVLVIAGQGHVLYKAGVPESAARRGVGTVKVLLPLDAAPTPADLATADWFRVVP